MIEKLIFNLFAFTLFILIFLKLIRKNDTNYVYLLILQFIGIAINFIELLFSKNFTIIIKCIMYILSVILPIFIIWFEYKKKTSFSEILNMFVAYIHIKIGKEEEAKKYLKRITEKNKENYKACKMLAQIYEKQEKYEQALEEYEKIYETDKTNYKFQIKIGELYGHIGRTKEAVETFNEILKKRPDCYEASIILGDIYYNNQAYKEATQVYIAALKYKPADYELYYNLGMSYTMLNDFRRAKENYEKAAQINSALYHARYSIGQLSLIYGELEEAEKYFMQCMDTEELEAGSYYYLARIAMIKGEIEKAKNYANIAIEEEPKIFKNIIEENIFAPIIDTLNKPSKEENNKKDKKKKLTQKETRIDKYLHNTCNLVDKLNNNDIEMIENIKKARDEQTLNNERQSRDI